MLDSMNSLYICQRCFFSLSIPQIVAPQPHPPIRNEMLHFVRRDAPLAPLHEMHGRREYEARTWRCINWHTELKWRTRSSGARDDDA